VDAIEAEVSMRLSIRSPSANLQDQVLSTFSSTVRKKKFSIKISSLFLPPGQLFLASLPEHIDLYFSSAKGGR
jgi:hypothetical protein